MKKFGEEAFLFQAAKSRVRRGEPQGQHSFLTSPYLMILNLEGPLFSTLSWEFCSSWSNPNIFFSLVETLL